MMNSISFNPIISNNCKVLILGTMPGIKSLEEQKYYAHERNIFWPIMFQLFNKKLSFDYKARVSFLLKNGIALWDTLQYCYREGSLDSNIKDAEPNKISEILVQNQSLKSVIFNGKSAEKYYDKFHQRIDGVSYYCMPSTSPANARMKFEDKMKAWALVKELV